MSDLYDDLASTAEDVRQTHISWVFMTQHAAFKVKKSVDFGFLDFTTLEKRRLACEAEVRLNRRFTSDVYDGVVPVARGEDGRHRFGGPGEVVDYAVYMRRLPDHTRGDFLVARGALKDAHLKKLAHRLAKFHRQAVVDETTQHFGLAETIRINVEENFEQTRESRAAYLTLEQVDEIERWQREFLVSSRDLLRARAQAGFSRDGHGDLRLEHVYFGDDGDVRIIDCIEFNDRFRLGDVAGDIAFLVMDLAFAGEPRMAERLLGLYAAETGDFALYDVIDFYLGYRAYVRAKIASYVSDDVDLPSPLRNQAAEQARRFYLLCLAEHARPLFRPQVVAVGGILASGKSTLADEIARRLGAPIVGSDLTRKQILGTAPTTRLFEGSFDGAYDPAVTERVYQTVDARAEHVLNSGRPVVLDASFRTPEMRAQARSLARRHEVPFTFVECRTGVEVCRERLAQRDFTTSVSDGRLEIFDDFVASFAPVTELPSDEHLVVDGVRSSRDLGDEIGSRLGAPERAWLPAERPLSGTPHITGERLRASRA